MLEPLLKMNLDKGNENFEPSSAMITSIDVGNNSFNIIPSQVEVKFNIRFNDNFSAISITQMLQDHFNSQMLKYDFDYFCNAEPFNEI